MAQQNLFEGCPWASHGDDSMHNGRLSEGTIIYTMDGALPVEYLVPGDRIITRSGAQLLTGLEVSNAGFALKFSNPQIIYADGMQTLAA